jgi:hypothetical protein
LPESSYADERRPRLLILAFSQLSRDPRVKRQLLTLRSRYEITVVGHGDPGIEGVTVVSLPTGDRTPALLRKARLAIRETAFAAHLYGIAYWRLPHIRWCWDQLSRERWDVVIANDVDPVPLANRLAPTHGVLVDLHEFAPRQYDDRPEWMRKVAPYHEWLVRRHVTEAAVTVTVSEGIAAAYREYGLDPVLVRSAAMFADVSPADVAEPIRHVHSGGAARSRLLETMIEATIRSRSNVTLDLYLVADHDRAYVAELEAMAATSDRVRINDAVAFEQLVPTLNHFDVGLCMIPPTTFNHVWCLPNKFFDFLQARLGVITGPSPEIAKIVNETRIGVVTADFEVDSLVDALDDLDPSVIAEWKRASASAAVAYSGERELARLVELVDDLVALSA